MGVDEFSKLIEMEKKTFRMFMIITGANLNLTIHFLGSTTTWLRMHLLSEKHKMIIKV